MKNTFKNVAEMKSEYQKKWDEENEFENSLIEKYPNLFPKDHNDHNSNPTAPECGVSCPVGWRDLVEQLCSCIDEYVTNNQIYTQTNKRRLKVFEWIWRVSRVGTLLNRIERMIDPHDWKNKKSYSSKESKEVEAAHPKRVKLQNLVGRFRRWLTPKYKWNKKPIPKVTIQQVKSKFGTLRFYYSGGDDKVTGMVRFGEMLSASICESTGVKGTLYAKGSWYVTASPEFAEKQGYRKVNG